MFGGRTPSRKFLLLTSENKDDIEKKPPIKSNLHCLLKVEASVTVVEEVPTLPYDVMVSRIAAARSVETTWMTIIDQNAAMEYFVAEARRELDRLAGKSKEQAALLLAAERVALKYRVVVMGSSIAANHLPAPGLDPLVLPGNPNAGLSKAALLRPSKWGRDQPCRPAAGATCSTCKGQHWWSPDEHTWCCASCFAPPSDTTRLAWAGAANASND